jgi:hypothetical protein
MSIQYLEPDEWFVVNDNDPHLRAIYISLPKPPALKRIDGYGKQIKEQRFERLEIPTRLKALEKEVERELIRKENLDKNYHITGYEIYKTFWEKLDLYYEDYQEEIKFIKKVWWHRINGYWFFNRGKPTYITGWHFFYLNFFYLGEAGQYPDYRDRDRRWFLIQKYAYECTEAFMDYDIRGNAQKRGGVFRMYDDGSRKFYGCCNTKGRRMGDTTKTMVPFHEMGAMKPGSLCGIISFGGEGAESTFEMKFIPAWQRFPLWLKPMYSNRFKAKSIDYEPPSTAYFEEGLGTILSAAGTADSQAYDGKPVTFLLADEQGKTSRKDVNSRWSTLKRCLQEGEVIKGYSIHPTTVEEMDEGGGKQFYEMMENADFYKRVKGNGQTFNGLLKVFFRASDGRNGYIDSYGYSVENEPTEWQREEGFVRGGFDVLNERREQLKRIGTAEAMAEYRQDQRKDPIYYMDSFVSETGGLRFDYVKIGEAMDRVLLGSKAKRYNIVCEPNNPDGERMLIPDADGKFLISLDISREMMNQRVRVLDYDPIQGMDVWTWKPKDMKTFIASVDPIRYFNPGDVKRTGKKFSKVGGVVFWNRDKRKDADENPMKWESCRTVVSYLHSPISPNEYLDDMLNMSVLFGAPMYPERNITAVWEHFVKRGYAGYLLYDLDVSTGRRKSNPGCYVGDKTEGFSELEFYSKYRIHKEEHIDIIEAFNGIKSIQDLTNYDILAALMYALIGSKGQYAEQVQRFSSGVLDLSKLHGLF